MQSPLFRSFFMGGIECSSHRLHWGKRLDVIGGTEHDRWVREDYRRFQGQGIYTIRSGIRWHLIEKRAGEYDFSSVLPALRASQAMGMQVIWDCCHYGYPEDIDIYKPEFVDRFARMTAAFAHVVKSETDTTPFFCPINEISFFSWGGGDASYLNPFSRGRGFELKVQLARAAIHAIEAIWESLPDARIVHVDPVINIVTDPSRPHEHPSAEGHRLAQYQGWDLISGRIWEQIGGKPEYLDILGLNYYSNNQWIHGGSTLDRHHSYYRPFYDIAREVYERYERPMFVAETGTEGDERPHWLRYMSEEVSQALQLGVPIEGMCLYPIINHPGWDNDRHCHNGLWDYADANGEREIYAPLAEELAHQRVNIAHVQHTLQAEKIERYAALREGSIKPNVCLFTDSLDPSGMGEHILILAEGLKADCHLTLVCPPQNEPFIRRAERLGIAVVPIEVRGQNRESWEQFRDFLHNHQIDILHVHAGIGWEAHDGVYAGHFASVPIIRTEHLPYLLTVRYQRDDYARVIERVETVITVSEAARDSYITNGIPAHKILAIRNGIPNRAGVRASAAWRDALFLPPNARLLVAIGRLETQKGYTYLLDALPTILRHAPDIILLIAGTGSLEFELREQAALAGISDHVRFLGRREDVAQLLDGADVFVMPSLFEGMPLALLEAMALGKKIVAARADGIVEVIDDGIEGRLVDLEDVDALAQGILEALAGGSAVQSWGDAARKRFARDFTADTMIASTLDLYRRQFERKTSNGHIPMTPMALENLERQMTPG